MKRCCCRAPDVKDDLNGKSTGSRFVAAAHSNGSSGSADIAGPLPSPFAAITVPLPASSPPTSSPPSRAGSLQGAGSWAGGVAGPSSIRGANGPLSSTPKKVTWEAPSLGSSLSNSHSAGTSLLSIPSAPTISSAGSSAGSRRGRPAAPADPSSNEGSCGSHIATPGEAVSAKAPQKLAAKGSKGQAELRLRHRCACSPREDPTSNRRRSASSESDAAPLEETEDPLLQSSGWRKLSEMSRGATAFVQLAENAYTGERAAIKFVPRGGGGSREVLEAELLRHRLCRAHPNIIQLREVFLLRRHLAIVMEYCPGGDLMQHLTSRSRQQGASGVRESDARWFFQQLVVALGYCHRVGVCGCCISLEACLLTDAEPRPQLKLCDFGCSFDDVAAPPVNAAASGTAQYTAPEVLSGAVARGGEAADIWACGVVLYVMLVGQFPFWQPEDDLLPTLGAQLKAQLPRMKAAKFQLPSNLSNGVKLLLKHLLDPDPGRRIRVDQILLDPWFLKNLPYNLEDLNAKVAMIASKRPHGFCRQSSEEIAAVVAEACGDTTPEPPDECMNGDVGL